MDMIFAIGTCLCNKSSRLLQRRTVVASLTAVIVVTAAGFYAVRRWEMESITAKRLVFQQINISEHADLGKFVEYTERATSSRKSYYGVAKFLQLKDKLRQHLKNAAEKKVKDYQIFINS